jgi:prepilin peptidase CpaA
MSLTMTVIVVGKVLVFAGLVSAAVTDVARRIIPNFLVLTVGGGGLIFRLAAADRHGVWTSAGIAGIVFVVLRLLSGLGALGGGDVKMITAVTLGQLPASLLPILLGICAAGGPIAIFYLARDWVRRRNGSQTSGAALSHLDMPYAPAILAGVAGHELWDVIT